jgi:hypothetical protein
MSVSFVPVELTDVPPPIVASNYRAVGKNTLIGCVDITVVKWRFVFRGCLHHRKGDSEWIAFPGKEYLDRDGERKFSNLCEFVNHGDARRFKEAALEAVHRPIARGAA